MLAITLVASSARASEENSAPVFLSLREALRLAIERHVDVIIANERVRRAAARLGQSASTLLPRIEAVSSESRQTTNLLARGIRLPSQDPVVGPYNSFDARFTLSQNLFDAAAFERFRAAWAGKKLSEAERRKARQDVLALVGTFYLDARRAREAVKAGQALLKRDSDKLKIFETRFRSGAASEVEWIRARRDLWQSRQALDRASLNELERRLDLAAALGLPSGRPLRFPKKERDLGIPIPSEDEIEAVRQTHPDVKAANELVRERKLERNAELAEFLPKVSGAMDYGASGSGPSDSEATATIGAKLSWPLFEGGRNFFRLREAKSAARESEARAKDAAIHAEAKTVGAIRALRQAGVFLEAKEADWELASKQWNLARRRYRNGSASFFEVMEAFAERALARDGVDEGGATVLMAEINLAHALGRMEEIVRGQERPK